MDPLFPQLPADLSGLTDEQLNEALEAHLEAVNRIRQNDADFVGERDAASVIDEMQAGVESVGRIRAEMQAREEAQASFAAEVERLAAEAGAEPAAEAEADEPEDEPEDGDEPAEAEAEAEAEEAPEAEATAEAEPEVEEAAEPIAAAAPPAPRRLRRPPAPSRDREPSSTPGGLTLVASAGIEGFRPGQPLDRPGLGRALVEAERTATVSAPGVEHRVVVASARYDFPEERRLDDRNAAENGRKIRALVEDDALVASGGLCAPLTPLYDSPVYAVADRPVRDGLASFQASRGGITFPPSLSLATAAGAITVITPAEDATPGSATKACLTIDCDDFDEATIEAISACVTHGNFGARSWPERVAELADLVAAAHAQAAEVELLDALKAGSTQVTAAAAGFGYGASSTLLSHILAAAAGVRSRQRMRPDQNLRALLPAWTRDLLVVDLINSQFDRFERNQAGVAALLGSFNVSVSWYIDGETGGGQVIGAQAGGALNPFPDEVKWFLFPEGTWIFLDGGRLDLGVVRDSTLNATNDFQVFYETFEGAAKIGPESLEITSTVCPSGAVAAPATAITC